jgi:tRNA uridine 5-carboxymethylaminomethyl modification enzyme
VKASLIKEGLKALGSTELQRGCKLIDLISRPGLTLDNLSTYIPALRNKLEAIQERKEEITEAAEIRMKYIGYIERERELADKMIRLENIKIKGKFEYASLQSLSTEARQKLTRIDPETMAQASRIPGVSPSDINVLLVLMKR